MSSDSFTFLSPSHNSTSCIDHVLRAGDLILSNMKVVYDCAIFDHFPLSVTLDVEVSDSFNSIKYDLSKKFVNWDKFDKNDYICKSENFLRNFNICDEIGCNIDHRIEIDECYNLIVNSILDASKDYCYVRKNKFMPVIGWNTHCRVKYQEAREALIEWIADGKVRSGDKFELTKATRKVFVNALNYFKKNSDKISNEIIANKYKSKDCKAFWNNCDNLISEIDG